MSHEIARLLLEHANSFPDRTEAVKTALSLGMPLQDIESYLDWLDMIRGKSAAGPDGDAPAAAREDASAESD